jgi:hypothetical protein
LDVDDANESGDSKHDNEDLEVLRHALDESQRYGNGPGRAVVIAWHVPWMRMGPCESIWLHCHYRAKF